jgi:SAM-dependent methyltransferase
VRFHASGKVTLDHVYTSPDPRPYFETLRALGYCIPQLAKPYFRRLIDEYRQEQQVRMPTVLDVGCSYGINGALLGYDSTMAELYERYCGVRAAAQTRETLLTRDRELAHARAPAKEIRLIGLDISSEAVGYARSAGFIDNAVLADLELWDPDERQRAVIAGTDLVISTGCIGYVTERTISRLVEACGEHKPWMAHFVLRMFPFEPIAESLATLGYETLDIESCFKQRRFANREEQALVLDTLSAHGVDPHGLESNGWLYAQLHLSRPRSRRDHAVVKPASIREPSGLPTTAAGGRP